MIGKYSQGEHLPAGHQHPNALTGVGSACAMLDAVCRRIKVRIPIWHAAEIRAEKI